MRPRLAALAAFFSAPLIATLITACGKESPSNNGANGNAAVALPETRSNQTSAPGGEPQEKKEDTVRTGDSDRSREKDDKWAREMAEKIIEQHLAKARERYTPTVPKPNEPGKAPQVFQVEDSVRYNEISFAAGKCVWLHETKPTLLRTGLEWTRERNGKSYLAVPLSVQNNGKGPLTIGALDTFKMVDSQNQVYEPAGLLSQVLRYAINDETVGKQMSFWYFNDARVAPGKEETRYLPFEIDHAELSTRKLYLAVPPVPALPKAGSDIGEVDVDRETGYIFKYIVLQKPD